MEMSDLFLGSRSAFSPDGRYIASIHDYVCEVRFSDSLLKAFHLECHGIIRDVQWSGDSSLVSCSVDQSSIVIFSISNGARVATLHQKSSRLSQLSWAIDSRTLLFLEDHLFRLTVWSVGGGIGSPAVKYIEDVQPWAKPTFAFSPNGRFVAAVLCRFGNRSSDNVIEVNDEHNCKETIENDKIGIFSTITWRKEKSINFSDIERVGGVKWSPDNDTVVVWSAYPPSSILLLSSHSEMILACWQPNNHGLWQGISQIVFSPSSQFLAVLSQANKVYILNYIGWYEERDIPHEPPSHDMECHVYQETQEGCPTKPLFKKVLERPVSISFLSHPAKGTKMDCSSRLSWSSGGRFLATQVASASAVVWIWNVADSFNICCVIAFQHPVKDFAWDPAQNVLAIVSGQDTVAIWNADSREMDSVSFSVPASSMPFRARHVSWCRGGTALVACSDHSSTVLALDRSKNKASTKDN